MTDKEQIERISKLLNELSLDDITSTEFDEEFPKQSINDLKDELWRMYCFAGDVSDTINMGDTAEQKPCEDYISRQAVLDLMRSLTRWCVRSEDGKFNNVGLLYDDVMFGIDNLPSIKPQESKPGHWIYDRTRDWDGECKYECSECGMGSDVDYAYCMRCGAKMGSEGRTI